MANDSWCKGEDGEGSASRSQAGIGHEEVLTLDSNPLSKFLSNANDIHGIFKNSVTSIFEKYHNGRQSTVKLWFGRKRNIFETVIFSNILFLKETTVNGSLVATKFSSAKKVFTYT